MIVNTVVALLVGVVCILIGISNRRGNLSMLHSYHRSRVAKEDEAAYGRLVGIGMIVIGASIGVYGALQALDHYCLDGRYAIIPTVVLIVGLVVGFVPVFYAMKKYNKGIF